MFTDARSKKVVLVAHCLLNHNARIDECAYFPGAMVETIQPFLDTGIGIVQLPCPELQCLGLDRRGRLKEGRDIGIREALLGDAKDACQALVQLVMREVAEYRREGFKVMGVVGNNGSPACGVEYTYYVETGFAPGRGAFISMLQDAMTAAGVTVPFIATQDFHWDEGIVKIRELLVREQEEA